MLHLPAEKQNASAATRTLGGGPADSKPTHRYGLFCLTVLGCPARGRLAPELSERPWVGGGVHLAELVDGHQGVDLGGGHRRVAEQLLHHPDVGAAVQQVGGE